MRVRPRVLAVARGAALLAAGIILLGASGPFSGAFAEFTSRLPAGNTTPKANAACLGSPPTVQLGTGNVGTPYNGKATTVVDIWGVERAADSSLVGYIVKTFNGHFWYVPPIPMYGEQIDEQAAVDLVGAPFKYVGCFTKDLPLPQGDY